ncbi:MAG TPA: peptide deformylase [Candidatus Nitrosotenuis sp.]|jgi:peptide deformylase|nr:peptide deformylase [Candidatus Nitrosotenuis sp.]
MTGYALPHYQGLVTSEKDITNVLRTPTILLSEENWDIARSVIEKLYDFRQNVLQGGAGLAAPQIGLNYSIFIYTPDRTTTSLRHVINPQYEPLGDHLVDSPEACFSVPLKCTHLNRWQTIKVRYQTLDGNWFEEILNGFAARVFQHEMDHLQGKLTIDHEGAKIMFFSNVHSFKSYMKCIHSEDAKSYSSQP